MAGATGDTTRGKVTEVHTCPGRRRGVALIAGGIGGNVIGWLTGAGCLAASLMTENALTRCAFKYAINMTGFTGSALMCTGQREAGDRMIKVRPDSRVTLRGRGVGRLERVAQE
jgi:hypothetical protein